MTPVTKHTSHAWPSARARAQTAWLAVAFWELLEGGGQLAEALHSADLDVSALQQLRFLLCHMRR